jgi:hypothetical protein
MWSSTENTPFRNNSPVLVIYYYYYYRTSHLRFENTCNFGASQASTLVPSFVVGVGPRGRSPETLRSRLRRQKGVWFSTILLGMNLWKPAHSKPCTFLSAGCRSKGSVCDRCLNCFSSFSSLSPELRALVAVTAGVRFLRNKRTHYQVRWTRGASLSGHFFGDNVGAQPQTAHANRWLKLDYTAPRVMSSMRKAPFLGKLLMFLEHFKRHILKRCYAQGWSFFWSTSSAGFALVL